MIDLKTLRKIFKDNLGKSNIGFKSKCSDCECEVIVNITPTSGGFGLQGGVLLECSPDEYIVKCPNCYKVNPKINDNKPKYKCITVK